MRRAKYVSKRVMIKKPSTKKMTLREIRKSILEEQEAMAGPFKHIDMTFRSDSKFGNYYIGIDFAGRVWMITNFSLAGIWAMRPENQNKKTIYAHGLEEVDILLGGGVVKQNQIEPPKRTNKPEKEIYETKQAYQEANDKKQQRKDEYDNRLRKRWGM